MLQQTRLNRDDVGRLVELVQPYNQLLAVRRLTEQGVFCLSCIVHGNVVRCAECELHVVAILVRLLTRHDWQQDVCNVVNASDALEGLSNLLLLCAELSIILEILICTATTNAKVRTRWRRRIIWSFEAGKFCSPGVPCKRMSCNGSTASHPITNLSVECLLGRSLRHVRVSLLHIHRQHTFFDFSDSGCQFLADQGISEDNYA